MLSQTQPPTIPETDKMHFKMTVAQTSDIIGRLLDVPPCPNLEQLTDDSIALVAQALECSADEARKILLQLEQHHIESGIKPRGTQLAPTQTMPVPGYGWYHQR